MARRKKKKGYYNDYPFKRTTKAERVQYLKENVFESNAFKEHITKVSIMLDVDKKIIRDVLEYYITEVSLMCHSISNNVRIIHLIGHLRLLIQPGNKI